MRREALWLLSCIGVCAVPSARAATGDLLLQYESALGTLPVQQGWTCEARCLKSNCPDHATPPVPGEAGECWFQGINGNHCTIEKGCGPDASGATRVEHYNAPTEPLTDPTACSYTEWLAFDDGEDFLDIPYPVPLPNRNLTFGPGDPITHWGPHSHPAFGAPGFINAPLGYAPLRIVTGGGVPNVKTLPASLLNNRNLGRIRLSKNYSIPPGTAAVTLVAKMACGNRDPRNEMVQLNGFGRRFAFGVNGLDNSPDVGRCGGGTNESSPLVLFGSRAVEVALARKDAWGPHIGEFFTVRLILRSNGSFEAWLNENPATRSTGTIGTGSGTNVQINPDEQAGTMWVDYVRLFEGELPVICGVPVFDVNSDGTVNEADLFNGTDGFLDCVTGPGAPAAIFDALSERCKCHDVNTDRQIDMVDFAAFQRCLSLDAAASDPACDD